MSPWCVFPVACDRRPEGGRRAAAMPPPGGRPPCRRHVTAADRRPEGGRRVMVIVSAEDAPDALCFLDASDTRKVDEVTFPEVTSNSFFASSTEYSRNRQKRSNEVTFGLFNIKEKYDFAFWSVLGFTGFTGRWGY